MDVDRFDQLCQSIKAALGSVPPVGAASDRPVRETFEARASQVGQLETVEQLLTEALAEFPLHPYLLDWRAEIRMRMIDENASYLATEGAIEDLRLATRVAPDYLLPHLRLADATYVLLDEPRDAAVLFAATVQKMETFVCSCVGGYAEALADADSLAESKAQLARWLLVFPGNERLRRAAAYIGLEDGTS